MRSPPCTSPSRPDGELQRVAVYGGVQSLEHALPIMAAEVQWCSREMNNIGTAKYDGLAEVGSNLLRCDGNLTHGILHQHSHYVPMCLRLRDQENWNARRWSSALTR